MGGVEESRTYQFLKQKLRVKVSFVFSSPRSMFQEGLETFNRVLDKKSTDRV